MPTISSGKVRSPRGFVNVGGNNVRLIELTVYLTNYQSASEFTAEAALDDPSNPGPAFWASPSNAVQASVFIDNGDGSGSGNVIQGTIDRASINWRTRMVSIHGTDNTSSALRSRSDEKFANQTPSQIVTTLAQRHGWTPHVDSTTDKAGKTFDFNQYAFNSDIQNDWDTITQLAEREGKVAFLVGKDFYYQDPGKATGGGVTIEYEPPTPASHASGNFIELKTMVDYELGNADSKVASFHDQKKAPVVGQQTITSPTDAAEAEASGLEFFDRKPGLTQDQAQGQAKSTAIMAGSYQKQVEVDMPGDVKVLANMKLTLTGTGTAFDQDYIIETVSHRISAHSGYRMTIEAKNVQTGGT